MKLLQNPVLRRSLPVSTQAICQRVGGRLSAPARLILWGKLLALRPEASPTGSLLGLMVRGPEQSRCSQTPAPQQSPSSKGSTRARPVESLDSALQPQGSCSMEAAPTTLSACIPQLTPSCLSVLCHSQVGSAPACDPSCTRPLPHAPSRPTSLRTRGLPRC